MMNKRLNSARAVVRHSARGANRPIAWHRRTFAPRTFKPVSSRFFQPRRAAVRIGASVRLGNRLPEALFDWECTPLPLSSGGGHSSGSAQGESAQVELVGA